jgi:fumarate hydratase class II
MAGKHGDQFVVDVFQTGSGTSTNMNMNEVLSSRANEILTGKKGGKTPVHPNDHVNLGQSRNDVIPSAIHIAALTAIRNRLLPALQVLCKEFPIKRPPLPMSQNRPDPSAGCHSHDPRPGISGYARQVELGMDRIRATEGRLSELALGARRWAPA